MNKRAPYKVLLIGGTGTLSYAVLQMALGKGHNVTIFNRGKAHADLPKRVKAFKGDFYNVTSLEQVANENFDIVVDFLSRKSSDIDRVYPIFRNSCRQYIFISTACVYRRGEKDFPIKESSAKPNKDWSYNTEKFECEMRLQALAKNSSSCFTIIRPYITYNERRIPFGVTPNYEYHRTIIERLKSGKPWFVWSKTGMKNYPISTATFTTDFAAGIVGLFMNEKARNEDFHITSEYRYTQKEILSLLCKKLEVPMNVIEFTTEELSSLLPLHKNMLIGDRALDAVFDNSKIRNAVPELEFNTSLDEGLDKIIAYWGKLNTYQYDYKFEALLDKAIETKGVKLSFVAYPNSTMKDRITYLCYKYLPLRIANQIVKLLK